MFRELRTAICFSLTGYQRRAWGCAAVFLALPLLAVSTQPTMALAEIAWQDNLRTAHAQAKQEGKHLLLHFYTDNCVWCDKLEAGAFKSPELNAALDLHYIPVKVHATKNPTLTKTFRVNRFPTDVLVTTDGAVLAHGVSPQTSEDYVAMLAQHTGQLPGGSSPQPSRDSSGAPIAGQPQFNQFAVAEPQAPESVAGQPMVGAHINPYDVVGVESRSDSQAAGGTEFALPAEEVQGEGLAFPSPIAATVASHGRSPVPSGMDGDAAEQPTTNLEPPRNSSVSFETPSLAMQGYCPVTLINEDRWQAGDSDYGLIHLGHLYLFANNEARTEFQADPEKFTPVLNGLDVVLFFEEHRVVEGSREWGLKDPDFQRVFFFANEDSYNHFIENHERYTRSAIDVTRQAAKDANRQVR